MNNATLLIEKITWDLASTSKAFRRISSYLLESPADFMNMSTQEIAIATAVSEPTVLRYSRHYGYKGIPEFRIALAMSLVAQTNQQSRSIPFLEPNVVDKAVVNRELKTAIAHSALNLLAPDRSIILDSGSTTAIFATQLRHVSALKILTTGLNVVDSLRGAAQHTIMLPAGTLRPESRSLGGRMVETSLQNMHFDTGYFGADSINPDSGLGTFNEEEASLSAALMSACSRIVVLADSSKFGSPALHRICALDHIDIIVTDTGIPPDIAQALTDKGCKVIFSDPL